MRHLSYIAGWMVKALAVVLAITILNFFLIRMAPGDPAIVLAGEAGAADEQFLEQVRSDFGLDRPLPIQLAAYVGNVLTLDLGQSYRAQRPVVDMLFERLPATLLLTGSAYLFALLLGPLLGALAATRPRTIFDSLLMVVALFFYATPIFWVGLLLILVFSVQLGWLPPFGMQSMIPVSGAWNQTLDVLRHLILPALTLGLFYIAVYVRLTRASMLETSSLDYVKTARAKGLPEWRVATAHVLRTALLPIITFAGLQAGHLVGGAVVVETVFAWPGIGRLAFDALFQRDYNLLLGVFLLSALMVVFFNMITDILVRLADPRIGSA
ncbi:ABC transporter permease [Pseudohoeflea coraliihabitans]|uniref:ABC transporter permease n=1 Tax=Pseudohoeflea coraliihabitans TaxID=2860393 RepID=A0ABS6WL24_9HYPH|nr:ABC transporter permease [Pseudohoeflea sp. DP4N28-3]MBW3096646.1 ABC transporter permease [Pseudohoeflea sp. DP4N28-3]